MKDKSKSIFIIFIKVKVGGRDMQKKQKKRATVGRGEREKREYGGGETEERKNGGVKG